MPVGTIDHGKDDDWVELTTVSDEVDTLFDAVTVALDNIFVCVIDGGVECNDAAGVDAIIVEVEFTNSSVVLGPRVSIAAPSLDVSKDEGKDEYWVALRRFPFVLEIEVNKDSVDFEKVVGACVYSIVFSVVAVRIVDDDDCVEPAMVSDVID